MGSFRASASPRRYTQEPRWHHERDITSCIKGIVKGEQSEGFEIVAVRTGLVQAAYLTPHSGL